MKTKKFYMLFLSFSSFLFSCTAGEIKTEKSIAYNMTDIPNGIKTDTATFGEGCFWCTEAFFQR
ncbi:hypothetical protein ACSTJO_00245, partial [Vibrio parahaemolyticus]